MPGSTVNMLVLGDSSIWGQGLQEPDKFHSRVQVAIPARNPTVTTVNKVVLAHSGATIGSGDPTNPSALTEPPVGEVPTSYPTIIQQCQQFTGPPAPNEVDLILVDGGINDVSIMNILNPTVTTTTLETYMRNYCYTAMKVLLVELERKFPNARIIVTGYFPIISTQSNLWLLDLFLYATTGLLGVILAEWMKQQIIVNCQCFAERSSSLLYWAVSEERSASGRQIDFADAYWFGLDGTRAALTANPWLFGINPDTSPQDTVQRHNACVVADAAPDRPDVNLYICDRASVGHPNPQGAAAYANAILAILFPPRRLTVRVSPSPVPLGVATSIIISAEDANTHAPVVGTVNIRNFDTLGRPIYTQFNTGTSYATTFREGRVMQFDTELRKWIAETTSPSGVVSATGYPNVEVPFVW